MRTCPPYLVVFFTLVCLSAAAQKSAPPPGSPRATVVRPANVYISADTSSQRVASITPGHELAIVEKNGPWLRVFANTDIQETSEDQPVFGTDEQIQPASGWMLDKGVISAQTPDGDNVLFGAAADAEAEAAEPHPPKNAAQDARLLYRRVAEYFPQSSHAAAALWRSADIGWQIDKGDVMSRPSAHERDAYLRDQINEDQMRKIIKKYPQTKWADYAAFEMIDNKLCGDWQGQPKCPEKESALYEKYADEHPQGARTAQALYNAAYRQGVLVDMYGADDDRRKADAARTKASGLAQKIIANFPDSDYAPRAASLVYKLQQHIAVYGADHD